MLPTGGRSSFRSGGVRSSSVSFSSWVVAFPSGSSAADSLPSRGFGSPGPLFLGAHLLSLIHGKRHVAGSLVWSACPLGLGLIRPSGFVRVQPGHVQSISIFGWIDVPMLALSFYSIML